MLGAAAIIAMVWLSYQPKPISVDTAKVTQGPLVVTVSEDGRTRIKERYVVSSPIGGRLSRITLEAGDLVEAGSTLIAEVEPTSPQLLDARTRKQTEALVKVTEAAQERAAADLERAQSTDKHATIEWKRSEALHKQKLISQAEYQNFEFLAQSAAAGLKSARMAVQVANYELEQAQAALLHTTEPNQIPGELFKITAPVCGHVLRLIQESSIVISPGMPLVELGDPTDLEVIVDVLSTDAVKIETGARVMLEHWGGDEPLNGVVKRVEPSAFTKISALGVEEQRVWVVVDFTDPLETRATLGDGFRVEPRIVIWESDNVIRVPTGALFRYDESWAVFIVGEHSLAKRRVVERGQSGDFESEIVSGLEAGETIIVHPSGSVKDGVLIRVRE